MAESSAPPVAARWLPAAFFLGFFGAFILLLAEPRAVRGSDTLAIVYALDVSDSLDSKVRDQPIGWTKPPKDEPGLVIFGNDDAVELPPRQRISLRYDQLPRPGATAPISARR